MDETICYLLLLQEIGAERRQEEGHWIKDHTVPKGWSWRIPEGNKFSYQKKFFLSPDGAMLSGRRAAILHMFATGATMEEVQVMREALQVCCHRLKYIKCFPPSD